MLRLFRRTPVAEPDSATVPGIVPPSAVGDGRTPSGPIEKTPKPETPTAAKTEKSAAVKAEAGNDIPSQEELDRSIVTAPPKKSWVRWILPFRYLYLYPKIAVEALDDWLIGLATLFGSEIIDDRKRLIRMMSVFGIAFLVGVLPLGYLSLAAILFGFAGVLAMGRAWVVNEKRRTAIVKKLADGDPDLMPDLRWSALISAFQLLNLFPLLYQHLQRDFGLYRVDGDTNFFDWLWFSLHMTYLKALPDFTTLYGLDMATISFESSWGRHVVLISRLMFDFLLIQAVVRLLAIRSTIREAVAAVKADPEMSVRLGRRAIEPLTEKLRDPDRAVRGAAANALMQLGEANQIHRITIEVEKAAAKAEAEETV